MNSKAVVVAVLVLSLFAVRVTAQIAAPTINLLSPSAAGLAGGYNVSIYGSGLSNATVSFGGISVPVTPFDDTHIAVTAPPHVEGTVDVVVTTPGGNATSPFTYKSLIVWNVTPAQGSTTGFQTRTIYVSYINGLSSVTFGGVAATIISYSYIGTIDVLTPPHDAGIVDVTVTMSDGVGTMTDAYTYVALPIVTSVTPDAGPTAGQQTVIIAGSGLATATRVTFGSISPAPIYAKSDTSLTVSTPGNPAGLVGVMIETPYDTRSYPDIYTYVAAPGIATVTPNSGSVSGGQPVTITGTDFGQASSVTFGGAAATITNNTATSLSVTTPAHAAGAVAVAVTAIGGTGTAASGYRYYAHFDANADGHVDAADIVFLVNYLFAGGPVPTAGDADGDGQVNVKDILYVVNAMFAAGPAPV